MIPEKRINYFKSLENTMIVVELKNNDSELLYLEEIDEECNIYTKTFGGGKEHSHFISYDSISGVISTNISYEEFKERDKRKSEKLIYK